MSGLPAGWIAVPLAEIGAIGEQTVLTGPFGSNLGKEDFISSGVPVLTIGCLGPDGVSKSKLLYVSESTASKLETYRLKAGDFLFSRMASVGRAGIVPNDLDGALFNYHLMRLRLDNQTILPRLFFYYVRGSHVVREYLESVSRGATRDGINTKLLLNMPVRLPPLREQGRIVAKIDSLSAKSKRARDHLDHVPRLVEKYKQAISAAAFRGDLTVSWRNDHCHAISTSALEEQRRSEWRAFHESGRANGRYVPPDPIDWRPSIDLPPTWLWASVDQVSCLIQYGTSAKTAENVQGVAVLRMGNIQDGKLNLSSLKFLPKDHFEFPALLLENGDVLFNRTNSAELVGKSAVYCGEPAKASFASYLIRVRCSGLLPELLSGYINSIYGRDWVAGVVSQQVGQANVNGTKLRQLGIPVMPQEEQHEMVRRIGAAFSWIDRLSSEATSARKLIAVLDQAVLAKAFRGELLPQDPNDEPASALLERIRAGSDEGSGQKRERAARGDRSGFANGKKLST